ncbi:MAG: DegT/DnrJ/EryC1/StrS family aminotransferase [Termitinemataceae bacterium]|nr:MAG: DegT/DnrJ/EryC1/StrS family aminotransferase [Termitinemataceae bacterium]
MIEVCSPSINRKEMDAVLTVLVEEKIGPGEQAERLIQLAKEKLSFDFCTALRSPVFALKSALSLLQLEQGSGVAVSAFSPRYYLKVIEESFLKPVIFDTAHGEPFPSAESISAAIERSKEEAPVRCIVLHHALGYAPKFDDIEALGIPIIEDCSTAFGSGFAASGALDGSAEAPNQSATDAGFVHCGTGGIFTILGLEERDVLTAGGGALLYACARRNGSVLRNSISSLPPEYALPDMNAAMAIVQLREAEKSAAKRKEYAEAFIKSAMQQGRHLQFAQPDGFIYNNYAFPLVLETGMKDVIAWAKRKEIAVELAFSSTLIGSGLVTQDLCPNAYSLSLRTAIFPIYPRLGGANVTKIAKLIQTLP